MDEAYSALDPLIRMDMQTVLLDLQKEIRKTIVFITHDLDEALRLGDRIAILRDGEVIQQGTSQDIVLRPADGYVENFVREVNRARVIHVEAVMDPFDGPDTSGTPDTSANLQIPADITIEDAVRILSDNPDTPAIVTDHTGKPIGKLDLHKLLKAMVSPKQ